MTGDREGRSVERAKEGFSAVFILLLVLSLPAFVAGDRFDIGPLYWDNWPIFLLTALLVPLVLMGLHGLVRGSLMHPSGRLAVAIGAAGLAVLLGWWIYMFIQPMLLHMVTKTGQDYDLVSQGEYRRDDVTTLRYRRKSCPLVQATNPDLGAFEYCVRTDQVSLAAAGQVVRLRIDVSPFGTWIAGPPIAVAGETKTNRRARPA